MGERLLDVLRLPFAGLGHFVDATLSDGDEGELGGDKKSVYCNQDENDSEAASDRPDTDLFNWTLLQGHEIHTDQIYIVVARN